MLHPTDGELDLLDALGDSVPLCMEALYEERPVSYGIAIQGESNSSESAKLK